MPVISMYFVKAGKLPENQVSRVLGERTCQGWNGSDVSGSPPSDGREGNGGRAKPNNDNKKGGLFTSHLCWVTHGFFDGPETVKTDDT